MGRPEEVGAWLQSQLSLDSVETVNYFRRRHKEASKDVKEF